MNRLIRSILVVGLAITTIMLVNLGADYMNPDIGQGLNPWFAFPWAVVNMVVIYKLTAPEKPWTKPHYDGHRPIGE